MELFENIRKKSLFSFNFPKNRELTPKASQEFGGFIEGTPYINTQYNYTNALTMTTQPENYRNIIDNYFKNCPEAIDMVLYVISDFLSDGFYFIPDTSDTKEKKTSEKKVEKANIWTMENNFTQGMEDGLFDYFALGNVGWWYKPDNGTSTPNMTKMVKVYNQNNTKKIKVKEIVNIDDTFETKTKEFKDEDYNRLVQFRHVAWSSVSIISSPLEIIGFMQHSGSSGPIVDFNTGQALPGKVNQPGMVRRIWPPSQIIHGKYMGWDGKPYGFSPMIASLPVISQIIMLRGYVGNYFEGAGTMDKLFMFKGMNPNDPSVKKFKQMLQTYKKAYKNRGNHVGTYGEDFKVEELNKWDKDMEFLNLYVASVASLAANFQMPMSRVQSILGLTNKSKPSDSADTAYWRFIKQQQNKIENMLNTQLFIPTFGVRIKFKNSYIQDDIRKSQLDTQNVSAIEGMQRIFREKDLDLSKEKIQELFMIKDSELVKFTEADRKKLQERMEGPENGKNGDKPESQDKGDKEVSKQRKGEQNKRQEATKLKNEGT